MENSAECSLVVAFGPLDDPRIDRTKKYSLIELVFLTIVASVCGANSWSHVVLVGEAKLEWLRRFFPFEHGVPSHDTIGRVFSLIDPKKFHECFLVWTQKIATITQGEIIAIDGKVCRSSHDDYRGRDAIHLVNAWAVTNGLSFGQFKVADKSNEITAIPELLELLAVKGAIITIDAMGCQKDIAASIVDHGADYVLALKGNQGCMHEEVKMYFECNKLRLQGAANPTAHLQTIEKEHGRIETRSYHQILVAEAIDWLPSASQWKCLSSIIIVESQRDIKDKVSQETRFYLSSLPINIKTAAAAVRGHWG